MSILLELFRQICYSSSFFFLIKDCYEKSGKHKIIVKKTNLNASMNFCFIFLVSTASQNKRARHRNVIFDGIAGDSQCKYFKNTKLRQ